MNTGLLESRNDLRGDHTRTELGASRQLTHCFIW